MNLLLMIINDPDESIYPTSHIQNGVRQLQYLNNITCNASEIKLWEMHCRRHIIIKERIAMVYTIQSNGYTCNLAMIETRRMRAAVLLIQHHSIILREGVYIPSRPGGGVGNISYIKQHDFGNACLPDLLLRDGLVFNCVSKVPNPTVW